MRRVLYHRVLVLCVWVVNWIALVSCGANPIMPSSPTPPAMAVRPQLPSATATIAVPTRAAVPAVTIAPDLTAPHTTVALASFNFSPSTLKARVGQPVRLELQNTDALRHQFAIDDSDIEALVPPGISQRLEFVISKPGTYTFACNIVEEGDHRSLGMVGTLIVEPAP